MGKTHGAPSDEERYEYPLLYLAYCKLCVEVDNEAEMSYKISVSLLTSSMACLNWCLNFLMYFFFVFLTGTNLYNYLINDC